MLAAIKMEVMTPLVQSPDEACIAIDFHMPTICSPIVQPGKPAEAAPVAAKQLFDTILSSGMIDLKELCLVSGKAAWMAYLDIYCLDADGALCCIAFCCCCIFIFEGGKFEKEPVNEGKRKLKLNNFPFSLTFVPHKNYIVADPTAEEESIMDTILTVVLDSSSQLVFLYKPGGPVLAHAQAIQDCVALTRQRIKELQIVVDEALLDMELDRGGTSSLHFSSLCDSLSHVHV